MKLGQLKKLLCLCSKNSLFTFDGKMYLQILGVAMGSHLGLDLANIPIAEWESKIVPSLYDSIDYGDVMFMTLLRSLERRILTKYYINCIDTIKIYQ